MTTIRGVTYQHYLYWQFKIRKFFSVIRISLVMEGLSARRLMRIRERNLKINQYKRIPTTEQTGFVFVTLHGTFNSNEFVFLTFFL